MLGPHLYLADQAPQRLTAESVYVGGDLPEVSTLHGTDHQRQAGRRDHRGGGTSRADQRHGGGIAVGSWVTVTTLCSPPNPVLIIDDEREARAGLWGAAQDCSLAAETESLAISIPPGSQRTFDSGCEGQGKL
jgi:hypothetical protein